LERKKETGDTFLLFLFDLDLFLLLLLLLLHSWVDAAVSIDPGRFLRKLRSALLFQLFHVVGVKPV